MDIGLEKLIEMIEQRLGKPVANLLLGLITLAVVGVSLHFSWLYLLRPVLFGLLEGWPWLVSAVKGVPVPKGHMPTFVVTLKIAAWAVYGIATAGLLFIVGGVVRLVMQDVSIARDVRKSEPWTQDRSNKELEKNWLR